MSKLRNRLQLELPLKALFEQPSIALLAQSLASLQPSEAIRIERVDRSGLERLPLSYAQERLWFIDQLEPNSAGYSLPGAVSISGELDLRQLEESLNELIERHENLRTRFPSHEGEARQEILPAVEFLLERVDLSDVQGERQQSEAQRRCQEEASRPFDLARGPLLRGLVLKLGEQEHILLLNMHHIISDGWSIGVLVRELSEAMTARREGRASRLPALPIQYVDYSVWQRGWLQAEGRLERQLGYWVKKLSGMAESLDLPSDYRRPSVQSFAGAMYEFVIPAELTGRLKGWSEKQGGTLYMGLLTVFTVLLHRYTGQEDICVGSPIANRQHAQTEGLIGMFVNTLAMRSRVTAQQTLTGLFEQVKGTCLEAYEHQDTPFEKVVDALRPQRNMSISPLFQVMLVLQNMEVGEQPGHIRPYPLASGISKFDLTLECTESGGGLSGLLEYSTALYERSSIERLAAHFIGLCAALLESPQARLWQVRYLGEAERRQVLQEFNAVPAAVTATSAAAEGDGESARAAGCVHELFAAQAQRAAQRVAVVFGERRLSYGELYEKSTALALYLQSLGVGPDSLVGLCVERSLELLVGILGILKAGGAYVPLDPQYPQERLRHMIGDSGVRIVLTQEGLRGTLGALVDEQTRLLTLDGEWESIAAQAAALEAEGTRLHDTAGPQHLAYVIYTSGSTGQPKGAGVYRRGLDNLLQWYRTTLSLTSADRVLVVTSASFDLTQKNLLGPLSCGASVHLGAEPFDAGVLVRQIENAGITVMNLTPSAFYAIADADVDDGGAAAAAVMAESTGCGGRLSSLRAAMLGGEPISASRLAGLVQRYRQLRVINSYGPTECADVCAYFELGPAQLQGRAVIPIGRPVPHTRLYVLDERCEPMPLGVAAEIHVGGIGVGSGYVNRPQLTAQRFVADPFDTDSSHEMPARLYKTGDLGRWRADGTLEYLGRMDTQVKIRGFRIELGEIEACLNRHPDIEESVVVAQGEAGERQLAAFYRPTARGGMPASELRAHLQGSLPAYMIPTAFERLEQIPLTPNGKVDRRSLEQRRMSRESGERHRAARNEMERCLVALWAEVLGLEPGQVGIDDNFFELGGHSLLATQLVSKLRNRLQLELPLKALFEQPSIALLAQSLASLQPSEAIRIERVDRSGLERLPLSYAQERLWFIDQLEPNSAGYSLPGAVSISGELDLRQLEESLNELIERHENLRTRFPSHEGEARQEILPAVEFLLERVDLSDVQGERQQSEAQRRCQEEASRPFDLARGPLLRGLVLKLGEQEHILLLNMHHIISDGWSIGVLVRELSEAMTARREGRASRLPALPIQYVDYSVWQRGWLQAEGRLERQLGYWVKKLSGMAESLDLPSDYRRPSVQSFAGAMYEFVIPAELTGRLKGWSEKQGGTLYMGLLTVFTVLLHRYTGQEDICVGSPIANRQHAQTEGLIGMFVNTLAMRSRVTAQQTLTGLFEQVKGTCLEAYEHQDTPFEKVVDALRPQAQHVDQPVVPGDAGAAEHGGGGAAWAHPPVSVGQRDQQVRSDVGVYGERRGFVGAVGVQHGVVRAEQHRAAGGALHRAVRGAVGESAGAALAGALPGGGGAAAGVAGVQRGAGGGDCDERGSRGGRRVGAGGGLRARVVRGTGAACGAARGGGVR